MRALVTALVLAVLAGTSVAQKNQAQSQLYHRIDGDQVKVAIRIRIDAGFHLYHTDLGPHEVVGIPTSIAMEPDSVEWSGLVLPEPKRFDALDAQGKQAFVLAHEGTIPGYVLGRLSDGASADGVKAKLKGLTCDEGVGATCWLYSEDLTSLGAGPDELFAAFPGADAFGAEASAAAETRPAVGSAPRAKLSDEEYENWQWSLDLEPRDAVVQRGLGMWLLLAFVAGLILNVMPCVLPVISIKVLSFVQQAGESRGRVLALGLAFSAGILVVFEALALLAVRAGLTWGEQFQSQGFLIAMIGIVFAFSLSLFGVYELGVPSGVGGLAAMRREGLGDAFAKGMLATVLATPCSGPFLGSTLTWTLKQPPTTVLAVFTMLGLGMASPYVVLTAFPGFLKLVPKPGAWMETFKQAMGFVLLATVVYLMISLKQDLMLFTVAFLVFVGIGCWWWGRFASFEHGTGRRMVTLATALAIGGAGAWISFVPFRGLFEDKPGHIAWIDFEPDVFEELIDSGQNVFVDFTADWCPNCKYNEFFVFESEPIRKLIADKKIATMKADITHDSPKTECIRDLMDRLGSKSIPFLAVFPAGDPWRPYTRNGVVTVGGLQEVLEALPESEPLVAGRP